MPPRESANIDSKTVDGFGEEWSAFDYSSHSQEELQALFEQYFSLVDWSALPPNAQAMDVGCGTGRWARFVAPRVGTMHCIDASKDALAVARRNLAGQPNCEFHLASVDALPIPDNSLDFAYSLGVLHHVPDTQRAIQACVRKLKPGAPFLVYLYYSLDNRPRWFRALWRVTDLTRQMIARQPFSVRYVASQAIAAGVYLPLARTARVLSALGADVSRVPLAAYRDRSFYVMRTDALDRFGTRLERRFSRDEIKSMLELAGLERIAFREDVPYWTAIAYRPEQE